MTTTETTYAIDPAHTTVEFVVRHMMISKVRGRFTDVSGTIVLPASANGIPSEVDVTVGAHSVDTSEPQRDGHLKSPDFFDIESFKHLTFKSTKIEAAGGNEFKLTGDLTIHGVTKSVTFEATYEGAGTDPYGNARIGYEAHAKINRSEFGMTFNAALETGGVIVSDDVKIELNVEAIPAK
jgi:polyisoprenoid-binding protein YceI